MSILEQPHSAIASDQFALTQWLFRLWKGELPFVQSSSGAQPEAVQEKLRRALPLEPQDFMTAAQRNDVAAYTYGENVSTPLLNFFNACIDNKHPGYIPPGGYLITKGTLALDNDFTDTPWPVIKTAGHEAVIFRATASTNSPFISITNGTADSASGKYWRGGELGGIRFEDTSGASASSAHALKLTGIWGTKFGYMRGEDLRADLINIPESLFSSTNPDPYAVTDCEFDGLEANDCVGWALNNSNFVGFTKCEIGFLRVTGGTAGGWKGFGESNTLRGYSIGSTAGWAFDGGTATTGGAASRVRIGLGELDNVENGFRINFEDVMNVEGARFIHRYQTSPNADADYWPRTAMDIASAASPSVNNVTANLIHRLESGGAEGTLGTFINLNSAGGNIVNLTVHQQIIDSASFGIDDTALYTGLNANTRALFTRDGKVILDTMLRPKALARITAAQDVPTSLGDIVFEVETLDNYSAYNTSTGVFTCPFTGIYTARYQLTVSGASAGETFTLLIIRNSTTEAGVIDYATGTGAQAYKVERTMICTAADTIKLQADTSGGSARAITTGQGNSFMEILLETGR